ncbi:MAG: DUF4139 domain-containing protein, partial [Gemmataceae bacterium]
GVEKQRRVVGKDQVITTAQLNLLTAEGLRGIPMSQVQRIRFTKASLDQEFRKALEILALGHDKQKKTVSVNFGGSGQRDVKVGYVAESPIWKTSYRLAVNKDGKVFLQGWAIVENTTDEDWNNVQLGLVSSRPISFRMDLYEPLFVPRPLVEPELFASLRPQVYGGDMDNGSWARRQPARTNSEPGNFDAEVDMVAPNSKPGAGFGFGGGIAGGQGGFAPPAEKMVDITKRLADRKLDFHKDVATAAVATDLGEYFEYVIRNPVSLPRQKSALLPIINDEVKADKVSIYNEGVHAKFPLRGLEFKNTTPLHLAQGPVTVFDSGVYGGDARIADLQPGETRLISYAVDLGVEVEPKQEDSENLLKVKIVKGILHQQFERKEAKTYRVKNRAQEERTVLIEHPYRSEFTLVKPEKAKERSRDVYRFEVKAAPGKPVDLVVEERLPHETTISLSNTNSDQVQYLLRATQVSAEVKTALEKAVALKIKIDDQQRDLAREQQELREIEQDQVRMRENMKALPQTSEVFKVYLKKFLDQEKQIEERREKVKKMREEYDTQKKNYENFLANLNVE